MSLFCSKCGKEIANAGALKMHEAHCKGPQGGATEGAGAAPGNGTTTVKPSEGDPGAENKGGFFKSVEDELNA